MNRNCINSYAFFDLETTGLPDIEFNKTKITEICLVAASKKNILDTEKSHLPRVLNKLSFCVNPFKQISSTSTQITGLDNFMLENENKFDENFVQLLNHFILQLPQPVCLVAHNGERFDFPIIQRQLKALNMTLPDELRCLDSLMFFRSYEDYLHREKLNEPKPMLDETTIEEESNGQTSEKALNEDSKPLATNDDMCTPSPKSDLNGAQERTEMLEPSTSIELTSEFIDTSEVLLAQDIKQKQKSNETTPSNRKIAIKKEKVGKRFLTCNTNEVTPHSKRRLFISDGSDSGADLPSKRMKFTLTAVHERFFGKEPPNSHYAESDALALMKCVVASKREFMEYAEENATFFKDIKPIGM